MEEARAVAILSALADGVNPSTGEIFPADSAYQSPEVVRALCFAVRALNGNTDTASMSTSQRPRQAATNAGKPWSDEEDRKLLTEFDRGTAIHELVRMHGRTLAGIEARLEKHGRLAAQQRATSNRYSKEASGSNGGSAGIAGPRHAPRG